MARIEKFGWQPYPQKHYESRFTRFYESFWTPKKFGYDKRRAYLSSEILSGQLTREEALARLATPELDEETMAHEFEYVATKQALANELFADGASSEVFATCRSSLYSAGGPLLERAQHAGDARSDVNFEDVFRLIMGIAWVQFPDSETLDRVVGVALDGLRRQPSS